MENYYTHHKRTNQLRLYFILQWLLQHRQLILDRISTDVSQPRGCLGGRQDSKITSKPVSIVGYQQPKICRDNDPELYREEEGRWKRDLVYL